MSDYDEGVSVEDSEDMSEQQEHVAKAPLEQSAPEQEEERAPPSVPDGAAGRKKQ